MKIRITLLTTSLFLALIISPQLAQAEVITNTVSNLMESSTQKACIVSGCNKEICSDKEATNSNCTARYPEYTCYASSSSCQRQTDGQCGWVQSQKLLSCVAQIRAVTETVLMTKDLPSWEKIYYSRLILNDQPLILELKPPFPLVKYDNETGYAAGFIMNIPANTAVEFEAKRIDGSSINSLRTSLYGSMNKEIQVGGNTLSLEKLEAGEYRVVLRTTNDQPLKVSIQLHDNQRACTPPPACLLRNPPCLLPLRDDYCEFSVEDLNRDKKVDLRDYSILSYEFLQPKRYKSADINHDGKVDLNDYSLLVQALSL